MSLLLAALLAAAVLPASAAQRDSPGLPRDYALPPVLVGALSDPSSPVFKAFQRETWRLELYRDPAAWPSLLSEARAAPGGPGIPRIAAGAVSAALGSRGAASRLLEEYPEL